MYYKLGLLFAQSDLLYFLKYVIGINCMKLAVFRIACLCLFSAVSQAAIVSFDVASFPGSAGRIESYTENGVKFGGAFTHTDVGLPGNPFNETAFIQYEGYSSMNIGMANGGLFNLLSIDIAELNMDTGGPASVTFIAQRPGSVMVSATFTTDGIINGTAGDFETFYFGDDFKGVHYVYIADALKDSIYTYSFDNIHVSAVPLPAAAWLFLSGLLAMVKLAKRK